MSAPTANKIILPLDTSNTGKKIRTQQRLVGSDLVEEHFFVPVRQADILGIYFCPYNGTIIATAHSFGTSGFFWLINPADSTILINIRRINIQSNIATSLTTPTCPRIAFTRFSFTGTASGATLSGAKRKTSDENAQGSFRTAITGMTLSTQQDFLYFCPPVAVGTAGWGLCPPSQEEFVPLSDETFMSLTAAEGICCWQADNGSTSDTRKFFVNLIWEEIYIP